MKLSRKEFLRKGLLSLGELACTVTGISSARGVEPTVRDEPDSVPPAGSDRYAVARNDRCLAGSCGCFVCAERCASRAITVVMGEGIRIDQAACNGCGACYDVCPVLPKAVSIVSGSR